MAAISIIVPVYNTPEAYFHLCMQSVLAQRFADWEVWLVDDGSASGIETVCDAYAANDPRFHVIHQQNKGLPGARNTGTRAALAANAAGYVIYLDPDDWWEPDTLAPLYEAAEQYRLDAVYFAFSIDKDTGREERRYFPAQAAGTLHFATAQDVEALELGILDASRCTMPAGLPSAWKYLIRKEFLAAKQLWFDEEQRYFEDLIFSFQLWEAAEKAAFYDAALYHYRVHSDSITLRYSKDSIKYEERLSNEIYKFLQQTQKSDAYFQAYNVRLRRAYFNALAEEMTNPANPRPMAQRIADWRTWPERYEFARRFAEVCRQSRAPQKRALYLAAFRLRSWPLTRALIRLNDWLYAQKHK